MRKRLAGYQSVETNVVGCAHSGRRVQSCLFGVNRLRLRRTEALPYAGLSTTTVTAALVAANPAVLVALLRSS
jgi:hypothetical protein